MSDRHRVAVYGTLKRGMSNHRLLAQSHFVGDDTIFSIALYDVGEYPAARQEKSEGVHVEVYAVDENVLMELDRLEECDPHNPDLGLYKRCECQTRYGVAWIYIYNRSVEGAMRQDRGSWRRS